MKNLKSLLTLALLAVATVTAQAATIIVNSNILTNKTWYRTNTYVLQGFIYVKNGATLTIQSGTIIKGDKATKGTLIIEKGSKLMAAGTVTQPIVFTSNFPVGQRNRGDWGGVIILGNAHVNQPGGTAIIEGGFTAPDGEYGGGLAPNDHDNSGTLKYVRIEYAGIPFQPNNEINGLTMGGVGDGTIIEHVQVSYSGDDSFEWFGGSVNCKWLVAYRGLDDDFDTDFGYNGNLQFCFGLRDPNVADVSGSHGFESDNDAAGSSLTPYTAATFSNVTIVGGNPAINSLFVAGARLRRNTRESLFNTIMMGYPAGLYIDGTASETNAANNDLEFKNNIIAGCATPLKVVTGSTFDINSYVTNQGGNDILANNSDVQLADVFNLATPNPMPAGGSPALTGGSFNAARLQNGFFTPVSYRGAFGTSNWMSCWTEFDSDNQPYTTNPIDNAPAASITTGDPLTHCTAVNVTFNANTGSGLAYQWYKGTAAQNGATGTSYANATAGTFKVVVSNSRGCTKTSNSLTTVVEAPAVTISNSNNLSICVNNPVQLSASSATAASYQWTQNGTDIGGATGTSYNATTAATYAVRVASASGCTKVSSNKVVTASTPKPVVTVNGSSGICPPQTTQLTSTTVSGLSYQWQVFGSAWTNISGATGANYTVTSAAQYRIRAISSLGCATSNSLGTTIFNTCRSGDDQSVITENTLVSVYPNPVNTEASIMVTLNETSHVAINIYDITGKLVMEVANEMFSEGENTVNFSTSTMKAGLYIAKVAVNDNAVQTIKLNIQRN